MPTAPQVPAPEPKIPKGFTLDTRMIVSAGLGLLCLGIIIGFKIRGGVPDLIETPERTIYKSAPCADCEEKRIKAERAVGEPEHSTPGDSSIPGL